MSELIPLLLYLVSQTATIPSLPPDSIMATQRGSVTTHTHASLTSAMHFHQITSKLIACF